jgi:sterol desaturase/sphingolipid hydroxylase (fatty acid hydroxylase superfamily)
MDAAGTTPRPLRWAPAWFQWSVFPAVLAGSVWASVLLMDRGWEPALAILGPQLLALASIALLERVHPLHRSWLHSKGDLSVDVRHALTIGSSLALAGPITLAMGVAIAGWLSERFGMGLWPDAWPLLAQLGAALVVGELPQYWVHRLEHERPWLWRFHALHHSAPRLYWLNAARFHPIDILMNYVPSYLLLIALGCSPSILALFGLVSAVHGNFQHANLQLRCGPLNWLFSMAELHRWHHSTLLDESNTNYGQQMIVWDVVFGTRFLPKGRRPPEEIGLTGGLSAFPMTYLAQLASPFRWRRIEEASQGPRTPTVGAEPSAAPASLQ